MKKILYLLISVSILSLLAGCAKSTPAVTQSVKAGSSNEKIAQNVVELIAVGEYSAAYGQFDSNLQANFSEAQLKEAWTQLTAQVGGFLKVKSVSTVDVQGHPVVVVTGQFEKDFIDVQLGFNANSQITGLAFAQAPK